MQKQSFIVNAAERDTPLIEYLSLHLSVSRKKTKQLLDQRVVFVNERRVWMAKHTLRRGDKVEVSGASQPVPRRDKAIRVLFEDSLLLIADNPTGTPANGPSSAESMLRDQTGIAALTAVHRLDRDTSGCLLLAKTPQAEEQLIKLFETHMITKTYHAIVLGEFPASLQTISKPLDGKTALTRITRLGANHVASHLRMVIDTGRTHQIRKHLTSVGYPVLGDRMYLTGKLSNPVLRSIPRQMLHSAQVSFTHPGTRQLIRAHSPFPPDFQHCLRSVRLA